MASMVGVLLHIISADEIGGDIARRVACLR
jgi:hypothetical protein